jgi:hypothetical protein
MKNADPCGRTKLQHPAHNEFGKGMSEYTPIFILGRQHSGNTMLATVLGRVPGVLSFSGEGQFFDRVVTFDRLKLEDRIAAVIQALNHSDSSPLAPTLCERLHEYLRHLELKKSGSAQPSASRLYGLAMDWIAELKGMSRWSQKATSYIFYVPRILQVFSRAHLIFLMRNPFDLLASQIRRSGGHINPANLLRFALGWNKGVKLALDYERRQPFNFLMVKYEDLVAEPAAVLARVFRFVELDFDPAYLDIPHVNRSETPYNLDSERRGINGSRIHYYRGVVSPRYERLIRAFVSKKILRMTYPEFCDSDGISDWSLDVTWVRVRGTAALIRQQVRLARREPVHTADRFWHRM